MGTTWIIEGGFCRDAVPSTWWQAWLGAGICIRVWGIICLERHLQLIFKAFYSWMVILRTPVRYGTLPNTWTDIHTNTWAPIISLLHINCERLIVYANTGSGNLVVTGIGSACCLLFLIIAGQEDFSIAAFQSLRMPLCVQTHKYTFIHTLGRVCIPANSMIVSLAFGSQIAQIHISMQTCLQTCLFTHSPEQTDNFCLW